MKNLLLSSITALTFNIITSYAADFKVICNPTEYGGTGMSVNIDGTSYPMVSKNNDILFEYTFDGTPKQYYYEIAGGSENEFTLFGKAREWDSKSTVTFYEVYGRRHTIGDNLIATIPRIYEPLPGYEKKSLLFQEGETPIINVHMKEADYSQLISITDDTKFKYNVDFDLYTPYEKFSFTNATISLSGQGSSELEKKPYKIELADDNDKHNSEIYNRKEFKLRNMRYDESYIRGKLVNEMSESLGLPITQSILCRLYINNKSYGLYDFTDMYKKKFVRNFFNPEKNTDGYIYGSLYKAVSGEYPVYLYKDFGSTPISELYECVVPSTLNTDPHQDIKAVLDWINNLPDTASVEEINKQFDLDMFLKYAAVEYMICQTDGALSNGNNFFFYVEPKNAKYHFFSYDFDSTLGKWCKADINGTIDVYVDTILEDDKKHYGSEAYRPPLLYTKLLKNPNVKPLFDEIMKNITENLFNIEALGKRLDYFHEFYMDDIKWDIESLYTKKIVQTQNIKGADVQEAFTVEMVENQFSDTDTDPENVRTYIKTRSNSLAKIYGITKFNSQGKFGEVGGKIKKLGKAKDDSSTESSNSQLSSKTSSLVFTLLSLLIAYLW